MRVSSFKIVKSETAVKRPVSYTHLDVYKRQGMADLCDELYKLPMYGHAESLNVSVAAGILMYDIARTMHE